jgi:predicted transport protein
MDVVDKAQETQLQNIQNKTGKTLEELFDFIKKSGLEKHSQVRDLLIKELALGYGDANTLVHVYKNSLEDKLLSSDSLENSLLSIYSGSREGLRPLHDAVMKAIHKLGDFEIAPKKTYLSLRRKKQFAMVCPGTKNRLEIGLNMKGVPSTERLQEQPAGGMCQYKVWLQDSSEIDEELLTWIKTAYESAG